VRVPEQTNPSPTAAGSGPAQASGEQPWHPLLIRAFAALDGAGVRWCLLRPPGNPARPTGDVDLLVHTRDLASVTGPLAAEGLARIPDAGTPDHSYLDYDPDTDCWIYLHITSRVAFGPLLELDTGTADACLSRRVYVDGVWRLTVEDEFWVTLLHVLLDKHEVSPRHRDRLQTLARSAEGAGPLAEAIAARAPSGRRPEQLLQAVRDGRWADLAEAAASLRERWRADTVAQRRASRLRSWVRLARGLGNPWRRRGISVALLGPDGAGKSTLASGLREHFFFPSDTYYMDVKDHELERARRLGVPGLTFAVYLATLWRRLASARWRQGRGHLVVFDRYSYDALVHVGEPLPPSRRVARWVHTRLFPRARLALVLDLPGEVMFARKGERDPADLEAERLRLLRLGERVPNVEVVDAGRSADAVRRESTARIWEQYARRWGAR
jgi:thymidylate kinase